MKISVEDVPRRHRLDRLTEAELSIFEATQRVEELPADERLTEAVILLGRARELVADYVDGVPVDPMKKVVVRIAASFTAEVERRLDEILNGSGGPTPRGILGGE